MKAVLDATGFSADLMPLVQHRPTPLFRVVDKPIIIHVIEFLVHNGFTKFEIVLSHLPEQIEEALDEGSRWGIKITYHLARDPQKPFSVLGPVAYGWKDSLVLVGRADVLPDFDPIKLKTSGHTKPLFLFTQEQRWTGWALMSPTFLASMRADAPFNALPEHVHDYHKQQTKNPVMEAVSFGGWQNANTAVIQQRTSSAAFPSSSRMVEPGIWLSRATAIHPTATITPPVFIGDHCQILEGANIGPNVIIENHCIIDRQSVVENSIICQQSYVGRSLEIRDAVVDRNTLINLSLETAVTIHDDFILAHLAPPPVSQQLFGIFERILALGMLLVLAPIAVLFTLFWGLKSTKVVKLPVRTQVTPLPTFQFYTFERPEGWLGGRIWRHLQFVPSLINIAKGELHFVGVHPLTPLQMDRLLPEWQKLYKKTKVGLITLADVDYAEQPSESERFASETYYAAHQRVRFDFHVFWRWLGVKLRHLLHLN
jgi:NDP-sugar pyrophosphorylase family protein